MILKVLHETLQRVLVIYAVQLVEEEEEERLQECVGEGGCPLTSVVNFDSMHLRHFKSPVGMQCR